MSIRPQVSTEDLHRILLANYGVQSARIAALNGYDDFNFHIQVEAMAEGVVLSSVSEHGYVLKVMNHLDSQNPQFVEAQHEVMRYLERQGIPCPIPVNTLHGSSFSIEQCGGEAGNIVRLLTFVPGSTLISAEPNPELFFNFGKFVGTLSKCILNFDHPGYHQRESIWKLESVLEIRKFLFVVSDETRLKLVNDILQEFEEKVLPLVASEKLKIGLVHGDLNEHNIIVGNNQIEGVLDFGDSHKSAQIFELAIGICYMLLHSNDEGCPRKIIEGYLTVCDLQDIEKEILKICICARICQSLVLGLYSHSLDPENTYVLGTQKNGWRIVSTLYGWSNEYVNNFWNLK